MRVRIDLVVTLILLVVSVVCVCGAGGRREHRRNDVGRRRVVSEATKQSKTVDFLNSVVGRSSDGRNPGEASIDSNIDVESSIAATAARKEEEDAGLGPFIVRIEKHVSHADFESRLREHENLLNSMTAQSPHEGYTNNLNKRAHRVTHRYRNVHYGLVVHGFTKHELESLPHVVSVIPVTKRYASSYSWGIDRLNQRLLPLDNNITMDYTGASVSVYIVDTGLDASHIEFASSASNPRVVKNIFSAFDSAATSSGTLPLDTDGQGHGTHVAGTIGGATVGVAPGANIFGLRVLNADGEGDTSDILQALDYVPDHQAQFACGSSSSRCPAVVSMSLGGPCDTDDCSDDSLVQAVEDLVQQGIVVSVAAGNEGCNACAGSPNAAPNAINGKLF
jgi:subtilisin family serine protease